MVLVPCSGTYPVEPVQGVDIFDCYRTARDLDPASPAKKPQLLVDAFPAHAEHRCEAALSDTQLYRPPRTSTGLVAREPDQPANEAMRQVEEGQVYKGVVR